MTQLYTLTGQRDNRLNLQIAQASRAANDLSIQIARAAKRDSTAMRIIAAVTLLFLPGTFIAVGFAFNSFPSYTRCLKAVSPFNPPFLYEQNVVRSVHNKIPSIRNICQF